MTVEAEETVVTEETMEPVETVETVKTVETVETDYTEDLKKYDLLTDNLKARDASASKKCVLILFGQIMNAVCLVERFPFIY